MPQQSRGTGIFKDFPDCTASVVSGYENGTGKRSIYLLSGIAVCADCGALMTRKVSTVNGKKYVYYMCSNNKKNKKCSSHRIKRQTWKAVYLIP